MLIISFQGNSQIIKVCRKPENNVDVREITFWLLKHITLYGKYLFLAKEKKWLLPIFQNSSFCLTAKFLNLWVGDDVVLLHVADAQILFEGLFNFFRESVYICICKKDKTTSLKQRQYFACTEVVTFFVRSWSNFIDLDFCKILIFIYNSDMHVWNIFLTKLFFFSIVGFKYIFSSVHFASACEFVFFCYFQTSCLTFWIMFLNLQNSN